MINSQRLESGLPVEGLGETLYVFSTIGSTNDEAKAFAEKGAPHGTLVVADEQSQGRGRSDRQWHTEQGSGLALSLILRPVSVASADSTLTVLGALAVVESLTNLGVEAWIKWPNDVIVSDGKLAGVLVETSWLGNEMDYAIMGIGVNVHPGSIPQTKLDFPATCVDHAVGDRVDRIDLLFDILGNLGSLYRAVGSEELVESWEKYLAYLHEQVLLRGEGSTMVGRLEGLEKNGRLRIRLDSGETILVGEGDLSLRPIDSS
jgi:BirA family biotin operon repressor/biotin-[acetyl-CoA-carboxylase] ligase